MNSNDRDFIAHYCDDRGLSKCAKYYKERFDSHKDYCALLVSARLREIQRDFANAKAHYETFCDEVKNGIESTFRHISGDEVVFDYKILQFALYIAYQRLCRLYNYLLSNSRYEKDCYKARKMLLKGCRLKIGVCYSALGLMYHYGYGVNPNYKKAIKYYQKAIDLGDVSAYSHLGAMYECGDGVEQNYKKAIELYQKTIDSGDNFGCFMLASMYYYGNGVKRDINKTFMLYQKAIDTVDNMLKGHTYYQLALMYKGGLGVERDYKKAVELLQKSADLIVDSATYYELGIMYEKGKGVKQNLRKALKYYKKSYKAEPNYKYGRENYVRLKSELSGNA